jgi:hypothetical protein
MQIVKTKSFQLAVNAQGDSNAAKFAILTPGRLDTKDYAHNVSHIKFLANRGFYAISHLTQQVPGIVLETSIYTVQQTALKLFMNL